MLEKTGVSDEVLAGLYVRRVPLTCRRRCLSLTRCSSACVSGRRRRCLVVDAAVWTLLSDGQGRWG